MSAEFKEVDCLNYGFDQFDRDRYEDWFEAYQNKSDDKNWFEAYQNESDDDDNGLDEGFQGDYNDEDYLSDLNW